MASNGVTLSLQGASGLLNKLRLLVPATRAAVRGAVAETALLIESDAKRFAPVDTGRLRSSIHADLAGNGLSATVGTNVSYALFIEFGTRRARAQPFLFPAFEKNRLRFLARLKAAGLSI